MNDRDTATGDSESRYFTCARGLWSFESSLRVAGIFALFFLRYCLFVSFRIMSFMYRVGNGASEETDISSYQGISFSV